VKDRSPRVVRVRGTSQVATLDDRSVDLKKYRRTVVYLRTSKCLLSKSVVCRVLRLIPNYPDRTRLLNEKLWHGLLI